MQAYTYTPTGQAATWASPYVVLNKWVLSALLKEETESEERTGRGREFHTVGAEYENDLWPKVTVRTDGTERVNLSEEDRKVRAGT